MWRSFPILKDYHRILGVDRDASKVEVRKAYLELAKQCHPDVNKSPEAVDKFKAVSEAFEILSDDSKRAELMQAGDRASPTRTGSTGHSAEEEVLRAARRESLRNLNRTLSWFEVFVHPRVLIVVLPLFIGASWYLSPSKPKVLDSTGTLLAWFNPRSKRWETPAPWDPNFKQSELKHIARHMVYDGSP